MWKTAKTAKDLNLAQKVAKMDEIQAEIEKQGRELWIKVYSEYLINGIYNHDMAKNQANIAYNTYMKKFYLS